MTEKNELIQEPQLDIMDEQDLIQALTVAQESFEAAQRLQEGLDGVKSPIEVGLLQVAAESYAKQFKLPEPALEAFSDIKDKAAAGAERVRRIINYLYALSKNVFQYIFDWLRSQSHSARTFIKMSKQFIGRADGFLNARTNQKITERGLINGLAINGIAPRRPSADFDNLVNMFDKANDSAAIVALERFLRACKNADDSYIDAAHNLRDELQSGMGVLMSVVNNPSTHPAFKRRAKDENVYFSSEPTFGQNYLTGYIASEVNPDGTFAYKATIARDTETVVRYESLPVLSAADILHISRAALRLSESIIRRSADEDKLQSMMREASFFTTRSNSASVAALRNFATVANNHYFAYLRLVVRSMHLLMRYCRLSLVVYEKENGV